MIGKVCEKYRRSRRCLLRRYRAGKAPAPEIRWSGEPGVELARHGVHRPGRYRPQTRKYSGIGVAAGRATWTKRLTENELSDFSRWWHDGCGETIIEAQHVDRNHSPEV